MAKIERAQLLAILATHFTAGELRQLCFELEIDYSDLEGATRKEKMVALITYAERFGRQPELIDYIRNKRPHVSWETGPSTADIASSNRGKNRRSSPPTESITIGGSVGPGAVIGGGRVQADNIAGRDVSINQAGAQPSVADFLRQLDALKAALTVAIEGGAFIDKQMAQTAESDLDAIRSAATADAPSGNRIKRRLSDLNETLTAAAAMNPSHHSQALETACEGGAALNRLAQQAF